MATWAIGDLHGCLDEYQRLLEAIGFDPVHDRLWFVGDLVNRGPDSLACLRAVRELGDRAVCVPGNHDLHLLARAAGERPRKQKDRFDDVLAAPDRAELLDWLRFRPLLHHDAGLGFTLVHAGLHPHWDLATARKLAREVEAELRRDDYERLFDYMYGDEPAQWSPALRGEQRIRFAINVFTRLRYCTPAGRLDLDPSGPPGSQPAGLLPWYDVPGRANADLRIVFGHWSQLGFARSNGAWCIDAGCLWGGHLTALRLDDEAHEVVQVPCEMRMTPGKD
jgi:bis(5'-nucleosyl)-tetraphosphatase (symmetrical)